MTQPTILLTPHKSTISAQGGALEVMLRVQAPDRPAATHGHVNSKRLALVIDRSGSMEGHRRAA